MQKKKAPSLPSDECMKHAALITVFLALIAFASCLVDIETENDRLKAELQDIKKVCDGM